MEKVRRTRRAEQAKQAFYKRKTGLRTKSLKIRKTLTKSFAWSVALVWDRNIDDTRIGKKKGLTFLSAGEEH